MACPKVGEQVGASLLARSLRASPIGLFNKRPIGRDWPPHTATAFPVRAQTALRTPSSDIPVWRSEPLLAEQPPREVQHENALPGIGLVPRAGDEDFRERVPDGQKRRELPLERRFGADVIAHLDVDELRPPLRDEVDLLLVQLPDVSLVAPPHQLQEDRVLVHAAPVHVARPQDRIAHSRVACVMLRLRAQVLLPLDVAAPRLIEDEGVAEAGDVAPDGDVVGGNPVGVEYVGDVVGRAEVAGIVHHALGQPLQHGGVGQRELLDEVAREDGLIDVADVAVRLRDVIVIAGPGEPDEPVEVVVDGPLPAEVGTVFAEAEREDVNLPVAPREQGRQIRAQEERVRSREVDIPSATCPRSLGFETRIVLKFQNRESNIAGIAILLAWIFRGVQSRKGCPEDTK